MLQRSLPKLSEQLSVLVRGRLWLQVLIAMALGVGFGTGIGPGTALVDAETAALIGQWVSLPGQLFLLAIQFVVVPLVVASVIRGISAGGSPEGLGQLSARTVGFFIFTTLIAVLIGVAVAWAIQPGLYIDNQMISAAMESSDEVASGAASLAAPAQMPGLAEIPNLIVSLFPADPLTTFVGGNMLQIVIAAAIIGVALLMTPAEQRRPLLELMASIQTVCMVIVGWVMRFAPLAVFGLLANITARVGPSALIGAGMYVVSVVLGLALLFCAYMLIIRIVAGFSPLRFLASAREVMLMAFSTSSSAAVMPLSLNVAEKQFALEPSVTRFVIPLGTTINMAGTALYQGVATIFLAQVFGVDLGLAGILLVMVMATGAAIGSPGTPGVGIVILATILTSVGIPAAGIALILGVDRILDMCRTVVNVSGDLSACIVVDRLGRKGGQGRFDAPSPAAKS